MQEMDYTTSIATDLYHPWSQAGLRETLEHSAKAGETPTSL